MSLEENKALVRRVTEEVFNKKNVAALDEFFAPNLVPNNPLPPGMSRDREGYRQLTTAILTAFPDFRVTIEDMVAEGDKVVVRATTRGTQEGDFMGAPATGKHATWSEIFIWRIEGGKVVETWAEVDRLGMMQQLGVVPPPGQGGG